MLINKRILLLLTIIVFIFSCKENYHSDFKSNLTNDSIEMWNSYLPMTGENENISFSFNSDGNAEIYGIDIYGNRKIHAYDSIPNDYGICNRWELINDSTLTIMCNSEYRILSYEKDSIRLKKLNNPGKDKIRVLYKVKGNWNIDKERLLWRDSIIEARREQRKIYDAKIKRGEIKVITEKADN